MTDDLTATTPAAHPGGDTLTGQPGPDRLDAFVSHQAATRPRAPVLRPQDGPALDFATLDAAVTALADDLAARGLRPGDRLMIVMENAPEAVVLILSALRAGAIAVPVNARLSADEMDRIIAVADARMTAFCDAGSADASAHALRAGAKPGVAPAMSAAPMLAPIAFSAPCAQARPVPMPDGPDRPAVILFTTGTTGQAKGVVLTHGNLIFGGGSSARERGMGPGDLILGVLPLTHVFGLTSMLCAALIAGAQIWLWPRFAAGAVLDALGQGVTLFPGVPQMHALIMAEARAQGRATLGSDMLKYVSSGAAPLDPSWKRQAEAFYGTALQNGYGMTECSAGATLTRNPPGDPDTSVGPPLPGVQVTLRPTGGEPGVGEVLIRGPNVMAGYFRDPQATAAVLDQAGFLHSGDLGRIDEQGRLHIVGRLKELIIRSGFNVYPPEVEAALNTHPEVVQSAVIGRPANGNEEVLAFCQIRPGSTVTEAALLDHARAHLTHYKLPSRIVTCDALPAAPTGKVLKHRLLAHFADRL